jgi:cob(I)alamin adenosyltransferase
VVPVAPRTFGGHYRPDDRFVQVTDPAELLSHDTFLGGELRRIHEVLQLAPAAVAEERATRIYPVRGSFEHLRRRSFDVVWMDPLDCSLHELTRRRVHNQGNAAVREMSEPGAPGHDWPNPKGEDVAGARSGGDLHGRLRGHGPILKLTSRASGGLRAHHHSIGSTTRRVALHDGIEHASHVVRINRVYTRVGDDGTTALGGGQRVAKDSVRIEAYGTVDELNSVIGVVVAAGLHESMRPQFFVIQQVLFNVGSDLCILQEDKLKWPVPGIEPRHVEQLEEWIDEWNDGLEPLKSFILPGGDLAAAQLHVARTVCRRAERDTIALSRVETVGAQVIPYLNRLSDLLFVAARYQAKLSGAGDILWDSRGY